MEPLTLEGLLGLASIGFLLLYYRLSPASVNTKIWTTFYFSILAYYFYFPDAFQAGVTSIRTSFAEEPIKALVVTASILAPLKYIQRKLRFARVNTLKMKYGFTGDPKTFEDMTVEQAQEIESNMAETSTDPAVSRTISASGHFINEDKRIEHQRMQATIHMMTAFVAYKVKSKNHSLVIARINEHHHRYGIKINSDDILYLIIHFGLAPVPWINKFGYRKVEPFEEQAIWTLWRENAVRMGVKYVPKTLTQAKEWRAKFEKTFRWREDANEKMAMAMLNQVLYPVPGPLQNFVARVFASIVDWDIVYFCQLEGLRPSPVIREVAYDVFRLCGFLIRELGLPRLSPYQRSPPEANSEGKMNFPHTPYDTMPWWQEASFWNLWGPRALLARFRGLPMPSKEFESDGVAFESMGAPHKHPKTQAAIEQKVRDNAEILENAPYGYRSAVGFQANRLMPPVEGPTYGDEMNSFPRDTPTTPATTERFTRKYERRGGGFSNLETIETAEDVGRVNKEEALKKTATPMMNNVPSAVQSTPAVSVSA